MPRKEVKKKIIFIPYKFPHFYDKAFLSCMKIRNLENLWPLYIFLFIALKNHRYGKIYKNKCLSGSGTNN